MLKRQNRRVYMVAFMDDHSRFITGYGIHASQSAALVLEVVRAAIVAHGTPQEMLTDNGSQYVTWRGTSAFHREMDKRGIKQIVAKPQRPQTLGKIERFWGTLWRECIETSVFLDLEDARRRIGHFIDYYNFQRPHQGIDGLVPADRFFGAASEVLATLRSRVAANALELARNGVPKAPFYVTGRIGERAFSVHAEGERMILKREGQERTEVDLGGPEAAEVPLIDSAAARHACGNAPAGLSRWFARRATWWKTKCAGRIALGCRLASAGRRASGSGGRAGRRGTWPRRDIMSGSQSIERQPQSRSAQPMVRRSGRAEGSARDVLPNSGTGQPRCPARGGGHPGGLGRRADADGGGRGRGPLGAAVLPLGAAGLGGPGAGLRTAAGGQGGQ